MLVDAVFHWKDQIISPLLIRTDSMVAKWILDKRSARSPVLNNLVRSLFLWLEESGTQLLTQYLSSEDNKVADLVSRAPGALRSVAMKTDYGLSQECFNRLQEITGPMSKDMCATLATAKLPNFNSLLRLHERPAVDSLFADWAQTSGQLYVHPPIALVRCMWDRIRTRLEPSIFLIPNWPSATWFNEIVSNSTTLMQIPFSDLEPTPWCAVPHCLRSSGLLAVRWSPSF